ncbi:hypothetical protein GCM10027261_19580 [Geodermatophilus arenarius]|uniref:Secreted protein n=1 Tax=Geodermatophilus arenarius TaxID=1137990 RepID=A0ABV9LJ60_9ACTN
MRLRPLVAGTALAATSVLALAAPAAAAPRPAHEADVVGVVQVDRGDRTVAQVQVRYRCAAGEDLGLWVSVKQTADRTADPRLEQEGSSGVSAAWSDSHRNAFTCDGRSRVGTFEVDQTEPAWDGGVRAGLGPLARGEAYVQFCLTDPDAPGPEGLLLSHSEFVHVR